MSGFINWGSDGADDRRIREQRETELLMEQARALALKKKLGIGGGSAAVSQPGSFIGFAIDGPLVGATATAVNEGISVITDANGRFQFNFEPTGEIRVEGGRDSITGIDFTGTLRSTPSSIVISPITTAIREIMDQGFTEPEATDSLFQFSENVLGIPVNSEKREEIKQVNFVKLAADGDQDLVKAQALATALEAAAETAAAAAEEVEVGLDRTSAKREWYKKIGQIAKQRNGSFNVDTSAKTTILESLSKLSESLTQSEYQAIKEETVAAIDKIKNIVLEDGINANYAVVATQALNKLYRGELSDNVKAAVGQSLNKTQVKTLINLTTTAARLSQITSTLPRISSQVSNITSDRFQWPTAIGFQVTQNEQSQNLILNYDPTEYDYKPTYRGGWIDETEYRVWWNTALDRWEAGSTLGTALLTGPTTQDSPLGNWTYIDSDDLARWGTLSITQVAPGNSDPVPDPPVNLPDLYMIIDTPPRATANSFTIRTANEVNITLTAAFTVTLATTGARPVSTTFTSAAIRNPTAVSQVTGNFSRFNYPAGTRLEYTVTLYIDNTRYDYAGTLTIGTETKIQPV